MPSGTKLPPGRLTRAVAAVLQRIADRAGVSQSDIGRAHVGTEMYISRSQVSKFFSGTKHIDVDQLNGLCQTLNVSVIEVIEAAEASLRPQLTLVPPTPEDSIDVVETPTIPLAHAADEGPKKSTSIPAPGEEPEPGPEDD